MTSFSWRWPLVWGLTLGVIWAGCLGPSPSTLTPKPEDVSAVGETPGVQGILPPPQFSRSTIHEPSTTDAEDSQAAEYETSLEAEAVIQFYQEELLRRGWTQEWEIAEEGQRQVGFGRGEKEMVIVVVTDNAPLGRGTGSPPQTTWVGIIYVLAKD